MAFNLENLLPIFGSFVNNGNNANISNHMRNDKIPDAPPPPKLSDISSVTDTSSKIKTNRRTAPMEIDDDDEDDDGMKIETTQHAATMSAQSTESLTTTAGLSMPESNLYLNGLLPSCSAGYMFFPTNTSTTAHNAMLMDPATTTLLSVAMKQLHQYPGFSMTSIDPSGVAATGAISSSGAPPVPADSANYPAPTSSSTLKEIIKTKNCILFPPSADALPPTIRERPPGCRTVFVGGLPENITEEIIREIFESCGEITTLRMSKKNFCHVRYRHESSIDRAIYLSGYRLRIFDSNDAINFGRLHVDYAQARDDQYDYECKKRQQLREQRHRERMTSSGSQSPPPIPHYTDHEASIVSEHLRNNDTFIKSVQTITVWLERGDCTKRNANAFYSMIQITHAHLRRLYADKQLLEDDLRKARESYRKQMLTMSKQVNQIEKVFGAASHKKVWDHFTKAQRKNIDQWKKLASELRSIQIEDDEMEMSDDSRDTSCISTKKARYDSESLKEENDSLRCQIDAMRNEVIMNRTELRQDSDCREKEIKVLQETIRNMQTQLLQTKMSEQKDAELIESLQHELKEARIRTLLLQTKIQSLVKKQRRENKSDSSKTKSIISEDIVVEEEKKIVSQQQTESDEKGENSETTIDNNQEVEEQDKPPIKEQDISNRTAADTESLNDKILPCLQALDKAEFKSLEMFEAKTIVLVSAFLVVQPHGANSQSILNYINSNIKTTQMESSALESVLSKYKNLFKPIDLESPDRTKWIFCGFE